MKVKRKKRFHGCKVFKLEKGLDPVSAYSAICSRIRGIYFAGWTYDQRTGKARAFG